MRVTIVGAGLAGLATAVHLARSGCVVTLVEASEPGGRARSTSHDGHLLNLGPHALYADAAAELDRLGVRYEARAPVVGARLLHGGRLAPPFAMGALLGFLASLPFRREEALAGVTVGRWLEELPATKRQRARALIRLVCYTDDPDLDAAIALRQLRLAGRGARYVDGGWQALVDGLQEQAAAGGARWRRGRAIALDGSRVLLREGEVDGDVVVVATSAERARELVPDLPASTVGRASCLDVALSSLPRGPGFVLGVDEPLYLSVHSLTASLGPGHVVHVASYGHAERERLEDLLDLARPGWREHVIHARYLPRIPVMHAVPTVGWVRPDLRVRDGVVLAGEWVGRGLLAGAALESARRAASVVQAGAV